MAAKADPTPDIPPSVRRGFNEAIGLDDPHPGRGWLPSPEQIQRWAAVIRDQREAERLDDHSDAYTNLKSIFDR